MGLGPARFRQKLIGFSKRHWVCLPFQETQWICSKKSTNATPSRYITQYHAKHPVWATKLSNQMVRPPPLAPVTAKKEKEWSRCSRGWSFQSQSLIGSDSQTRFLGKVIIACLGVPVGGFGIGIG